MMESTGTKRTIRGVVICCGSRRAKFQRCSSTGCGDPSKYLCDYIIQQPNAGLSALQTCDEAICQRHAKVVGPNRHYCPKHASEREKLAL